MKIKLYTFITGLLMAACVTSYGQEIVSEFTYNFGKVFSYNDLVTCSDGSVISGIYCYDPNTYEDTGFHVCKCSPNGQLLDSVTFVSGWELYEIPDMSDTFLLPNFYENDANSTIGVTMTFIDADLNTINTISTPILSNFEPPISIDAMFISPSSDLIISFWIDETFHLARIGLDGTLKAHEAVPEVLPYNWSYTYTSDSTLCYESFGVYDESPERFYKLGGFITDESEPWPLIAYLFNSKLQLTETIVYRDLDETKYCDFLTREHIVPLKNGISSASHILAANIHFPDDSFSTSLIKYDADNNPTAITSFEYSSPGYSLPINTIVTNNNQIYHTYEFYPDNYPYPLIKLAHLDENLNIKWNITLPQVLNGLTYGTTLKVLSNGDIAVSIASFRSTYSRLYIYIIHDNDPTSIPESNIAETPFTLYPNPVKDQLGLNFAEGNAPKSVYLYDLQGRLVGTKCDNMETIDMSKMPSGVYMLRVTMKDGTSYHKKILKE